MLLRLGVVVVAVLLAIFFLNSLLEIIISILMIGIGILVLAVLGGSSFHLLSNWMTTGNIFR